MLVEVLKRPATEILRKRPSIADEEVEIVRKRPSMQFEEVDEEIDTSEPKVTSHQRRIFNDVVRTDNVPSQAILDHIKAIQDSGYGKDKRKKLDMCIQKWNAGGWSDPYFKDSSQHTFGHEPRLAAASRPSS